MAFEESDEEIIKSLKDQISTQSKNRLNAFYSNVTTLKRLDYVDIKAMTKQIRLTGRINDKYECPIKGCKYRHKRLFHVVQHLYSHTKFKYFGCYKCNKRLATYHTLRKHFIRYHDTHTLQRSDVRLYRPNSKEYVLLKDCDPDEYVT